MRLTLQQHELDEIDIEQKDEALEDISEYLETARLGHLDNAKCIELIEYSIKRLKEVLI